MFPTSRGHPEGPEGLRHRRVVARVRKAGDHDADDAHDDAEEVEAVPLVREVIHAPGGGGSTRSRDEYQCRVHSISFEIWTTKQYVNLDQWKSECGGGCSAFYTSLLIK